MHTIHRVVIFGEGAMGAYFVTQILNVAEFWTAVLARGER